MRGVKIRKYCRRSLRMHFRRDANAIAADCIARPKVHAGVGVHAVP
jgi:hypothetical protein